MKSIFSAFKFICFSSALLLGSLVVAQNQTVSGDLTVTGAIFANEEIVFPTSGGGAFVGPLGMFSDESLSLVVGGSSDLSEVSLSLSIFEVKSPEISPDPELSWFRLTKSGSLVTPSGAAVSSVSSPSKLVMTNADGKIDHSLLSFIDESGYFSMDANSDPFAWYADSSVSISSSYVIFGGDDKGSILLPHRLSFVTQTSSGQISTSYAEGSITATIYDWNLEQYSAGPLVLNVSEVTGSGVSITSSANKLVKANSLGKIDSSYLPVALRVAPSGDLPMGDFTEHGSLPALID